MGKGLKPMEEHAATFNSPVEIGTRLALILVCLGEKYSLDDLVMLDYSLLYSEEFGGPENLHPALPNHVAEIAHRRNAIPKALNFMLKRGLIELIIEKSGHYYACNENSSEFVACLRSSYYKKSWIRLNWISDNRTKIIETKIIELAKHSE